MDVGQLAATLTEWLRPALPFLLDAGKKAAEQAGEKLGSETWKTARKLWAKLRPEVEGESPVSAAAGDLASEPDDPDAAARSRTTVSSSASPAGAGAARAPGATSLASALLSPHPPLDSEPSGL